MLTSIQIDLIKHLKSVGFGYAKFAESVEKSGHCSSAQYETMINMKSRIEDIKNNGWGGYNDDSDCDVDVSYEEVMRGSCFF